MVHGVWRMVYGSCCMVYGLRFWSMIYGSPREEPRARGPEGVPHLKRCGIRKFGFRISSFGIRVQVFLFLIFVFAYG